MTDIKLGRDKRANIAALRQAKIYPPRQAAAAAMWIVAAVIHELPQSSRSLMFHLMDCGSWIAAAKFEGSCKVCRPYNLSLICINEMRNETDK